MGTVVNLAVTSFHAGSLEITRTVPLMFLSKINELILIEEEG